MKLLIVYDVATSEDGGARRLRRVAQACQDYGQRVQKSVFECSVGEKEWVLLRARLLQEMDADQDSIRVYFLEADIKIEHHGTHVPLDLDGPLII
ncbi:MAG: CRISPR-associated endonuclease Cas2 [Fimbriiglobus sp.]